jgi:hypothetical protein
MPTRPPRAAITEKTVLYRIPGMEAVSVQSDLVYRTATDGPLALDLYLPGKTPSRGTAIQSAVTQGSGTNPLLPAVILVLGYSDVGAEARLGCKFKEMGSYISWAKLIAASGLAAVTYTNREPGADLEALLRFVRENGASLGIDPGRIGLWAASGNVPMALSLLLASERDQFLRCAVLCYGLMLDLDGATGVAEAAKTWGFVNPCAGKSVADLSPQVPMFVARAGQDQTPHLNQALDSFVSHALARNLPLTLANHPTGPHAFDLFDDSQTTRTIIQQILGFMRCHLLVESGR